MVAAVRGGQSLREVARTFAVGVATVAYWVERAKGQRLDRVDWSDQSHAPHKTRRTDTALAKLAKLRRRVRRFKEVGKILNKLQSPNLDKALTFFDDKLLPSTSNAVERGNRRHRKMQKTVYRVRTQEHIHDRIALDMLRDSQKEGRTNTVKVLHRARAGEKSR